MFKNNLRPSRDLQYGYQATYREYFDYSMEVVEGVLEGAVDLTFDGGVAVAEQLWDVVKSIISFSNGLMAGLFESLGVQELEFLPFCRDFESLTDLRDELIRYCPRTFCYHDVQGDGEEEITAPEDLEGDNGGEVFQKNMAKQTARFAEKIA